MIIQKKYFVSPKNALQNKAFKTVVIATASGHTGVRATEVFEGLKVIAVTLPTGFWKPDTQELTKKNRQKIVANGGFILTTTPLFGGIGRPMQKNSIHIRLEPL